MQVSNSSSGAASFFSQTQNTPAKPAANNATTPQPRDAAQRRRENDKANENGSAPRDSNKFLDFLKKNHLSADELGKLPPAERQALQNEASVSPNADAQQVKASYQLQHAAFAVSLIVNSV